MTEGGDKLLPMTVIGGAILERPTCFGSFTEVNIRENIRENFLNRNSGTGVGGGCRAWLFSFLGRGLM